MVLFTVGLAAATCETVPAPEEFASLVLRAAGDAVAAREAREQLPCVGLALSPADAALYHRAMAEDAWSRGADVEALAEMRSARAAAPEWRPPARLVPLWEAARPDPLAPSLPWDGLVDGESGKVYLDRAAILQRFVRGEWETRYLLPLSGAGDTMPPAPDRSLNLLAPAGVRGRQGPAVGAVVTGIGLTVTGAVAFGLSVAWNAEFKDLDNPNVRSTADLADVGNRTNAAAISAWVFTGAGAICIGASLVHVEFQ